MPIFAKVAICGRNRHVQILIAIFAVQGQRNQYLKSRIQMPCRCCGASRPSKEPTLIAHDAIGPPDWPLTPENEKKTLKYMLEQANKPNDMRCGCGSIKAKDGEPFTHYCCDCKARLV